MFTGSGSRVLPRGTLSQVDHYRFCTHGAGPRIGKHSTVLATILIILWHQQRVRKSEAYLDLSFILQCNEGGN